MFGLITRRRHEAEIAAIRSYNDALRERCETAEENERAERVARGTITRQHAELDSANRRLAGRVEELKRRLDDRGDVAQKRGADLGRLDNRFGKLEAEYLHIDGYAARMEVRLDRALSGAARWMTATWARDRRISILKQQLDATRTNLVASQARVAELHEELRKAEAAADPRPPEGGARHPRPSSELRAARDHAAALERQLRVLTLANQRCTCQRWEALS